MATQTLRNGNNARAVMRSGPVRSILRRPEPLALSPRSSAFTQIVSFSVQCSPSTTRAMKSPRVHFPPSPSQLIATFATHSLESYDRGPISVSPNPLTIPGWGERVYSPSLEGFRLQPTPKVFRTLTYHPSPIIADFEDPRSPKLPLAKVNDTMATSTVRFASFLSTHGITRPSQSLDKALSSYPRSPYPSAPISPSNIGETGLSAAEDEMDTRGRQLSRSSKVPTGPARARARAQSVQERRKAKRLTLGPKFNMSVAKSPSPLGRSIFSPAVSSLNRTHKPTPLALDSLTQEFWQAVSFAPSASEPSADESMVTALEYPESATEYEEKLDMTLRSASQPPVLYADADGALWSPGLPKPGAAIERIRETLMSPAVGKSLGRTSTIVRKDYTAPSPNDPFAAFPSFRTALTGGDGPQYPPRVVRY